MWRIICIVAITLCFALSPKLSSGESVLPKETGDTAAEAMRLLASGVHKFNLSNGLRVIFYRRRVSPVFAGQVWVKVGAVNEIQGKTGTAHLLEHMAFKGTESIGTKDSARERELLDYYESLLDRQALKTSISDAEELKKTEKKLEELWMDDEFASAYRMRGASGLNAATGEDYTFYLVNLPSKEFEYWCWAESERLLHPVFRQFYKERDVVVEERRQRIDDNPAGLLYETLLYSAYKNHPYRMPIIGTQADLKGLRTKDIKDLHQQFYRADNIVLSVVGDLEPNTVLEMTEKYFGRLRKPSTPLPKVCCEEPPQQGERSVRLNFDAGPRLFMAYHKPSYPHPDDAAFSVFGSLLSRGRGSILRRELVQRKQLASSVSSFEAPGDLYPPLFVLFAEPIRGVAAARLVDEIQLLLDSFKSSVVGEEELKAAKKRIWVSELRRMNTNGGLAELLAYNELLRGDWQSIFEEQDRINSVSADDIKHIAVSYLNLKNRTAAELIKKANP